MAVKKIYLNVYSAAVESALTKFSIEFFFFFCSQSAGNKSPKETILKKEIRHIWPGVLIIKDEVAQVITGGITRHLVECRETKINITLWPFTKDVNRAINQSEFEANTRNPRQARENAWEHGTIGLLRKWHELC